MGQQNFLWDQNQIAKMLLATKAISINPNDVQGDGRQDVLPLILLNV